MVLATIGRAGAVTPDNVLFEAGRTGESIRERLLKGFIPHTPTSDLLGAQRATTVTGFKELLSRQQPPGGNEKSYRGAGPTMVAHKFSGHFPED